MTETTNGGATAGGTGDVTERRARLALGLIEQLEGAIGYGVSEAEAIDVMMEVAAGYMADQAVEEEDAALRRRAIAWGECLTRRVEASAAVQLAPMPGYREMVADLRRDLAAFREAARVIPTGQIQHTLCEMRIEALTGVLTRIDGEPS